MTGNTVKRLFQSLYVHVPFCTRKCDYCAFYSRPDCGEADRRAYLARIGCEFAESASACAPLHSVFIGGGTPSCLTVRELRELLGRIRDNFTLAPDAEFTVECNPDSLSPARIDTMGAHGVNRISLGVQSWQPALRCTLGRRGSLARLPDHLDRLRACGIRNLGLDLIYGIPGQTPALWQQDLERAIACGVDHVSTYALTVEEGSRLARRRDLAIPDDDTTAAMWHQAEAVLSTAGLRRYEVSNFARPGHECRHNLEIWLGATYLGCGPAASSFDGDLRWTNPPDLVAWLKPGCRPEEDPLPPDRRATEILGFGLRTVAGWPLALFCERTGFDCRDLRGVEIRDLVADGLLELTDTCLRPTRRGLLFADTIAERLL